MNLSGGGRSSAFEAPAPRALKSDEFAALYAEHRPSVYRVALAMTGDRALAEDLAHEAFVRAWRALSGLRDPEAAGAYLRTTAVNLARRTLRRRALELRHHISQVAHHEPDRDGKLAVVGALQTLPPRQRACVVMRYFEDLTEEQTAAALGVSIGTVKSQTHKALKRLQGILGDLDG